MGRVFLSYAREDRAIADKISCVLQRAGHDVWWDRQIDGGEEFSTEIEAALDQADIVFVVWSAHSAKSPWVRDEAAIGRDSKRLLPASIDGSPPPMGFRQFQTLDLAGWKGTERDSRTAQLLASVERRLKSRRAAAAPLPAPPAPGIAKRLRGWRLLAAGGVMLVIAGALTFPVVRYFRADAQPASLAVLPFKNMAAGDSYFAEGVAEEIANQLSREPQFKVAGRTSSNLFKDAADLQDVGRRLHVAYLLEGSVRSAGQQVKVDVSLVDTRNGMRLWNQDFQGSLNDIFAIQDRIGHEVAAHLSKQLIPHSPLVGTTTTRGDVYSLYVTARQLMNLREPAKIAAATDLLRQAVRLDPNYAPAWAQLALSIELGRAYGQDDPSAHRISNEEQIGYAKRAISLAPNLGEAHAIYGLLLETDTNDAKLLRESGQELEKAVKLNPNDALAWYWLSDRRFDASDFGGALAAIRYTASIDPFFIFSLKYSFEAWELDHREDALRFIDDRAANHPDPFSRESALQFLSFLKNDLVGAYRHSKAEYEVGSVDQKPIAQKDMGAALLELGLYDQAEQFVSKEIVASRRSWTLPNEAPVTKQSALDFWLEHDELSPKLFPRLWVKEGRSKRLVDLYDQVFTSPEDMASRFPHITFVEYAPLLAIGFQQAGRHAEGIRFLMIANAMCESAIGRGPSPRWFRVRCSRVGALMGRKDEALEMLERAFAQGWRPWDGEFPKQADEPAYVLVRSDPRLARMDAQIAQELAEQRRRLLQSGL